MMGITDSDALVDRFVSFLAGGITPFHVADVVLRRLLDNGFSQLDAQKPWTEAIGSRLVLSFGDGALIAIRSGSSPITEGALILAAHGDSPALKLKEQAIEWRKGYLCIPTELYGSPIVSTWLDRTLGVAGRVATSDGESRLLDLSVKAVIPNVAVHLNRKVNQGFVYNAQDHLVAIAGVSSNGEGDDPVHGAVMESLGGNSSWETELFLYDPGPAEKAGDGRLIVGPRIDDLAGVFTNLEAFLSFEGSRPVVFVLYNHEEVGSMTGEGAQSDALMRFLRRWVAAGGGDQESVELCAARSLLVSNDAAHALHPSFNDKHDPGYAPVLGGGPVLKQSGTLRYATTAATGVAVRRACERIGIPLQRFLSRSDIRSGSTVGPVSWARTGVPTVDLGAGLLAMHSIRETAGAEDLGMLIRLLGTLIEEG